MIRNTLRIEHDKWYTPINTSKRLIEKSIELIGIDNISEIIEPSGGNGSFSNYLFDNYKNYKNVLAYDLFPEESRIIKQDFIQLSLEYKKNRLFIGNPPFGSKGKLAKKFLLKSMANSDYIGYILPTSYYNCDYYWNKEDHFKCIYKEIINDFGSTAPCCYILWKKIEANVVKNFINKYGINLILKRDSREYTEEYLKKNNNIIIQFGNNYLTNNIYTKKNTIIATSFWVINTNSKELDDYIRLIASNGYLRSLSKVNLYSHTKITLYNLLYNACKDKEFKIDNI